MGRCGVAGAPGAHLQGGQGPNVGRGAVYTGIFVGTLATYAPIPAVFFLFPCSFRRQTRALVVLGPGAAHGCPPASATRDCGAHKHKNPGRDPKSHGGGPGRNCSRGARKAFLFRSPFYRGGLGNWGALGVGSRGGAGPKMPHPWCPAGRCRGHDLKRPQPRFWPLCWSR